MAINNYSQLEPMSDLRGYFKKGERRKLYYACDKWRDRLLIRLLWKTGRRITEVLNLKVADINFEDKMIYWNILKKSKKMMKLKPVDTKTLQLLEWYIAQIGITSEHYVINNGDPTKPLSRQRAFQIIRRAGRLAGITKVGEKKIHPHHFRHSFIIDMAKKLKSPADVRKLQIFMEHSNLGVTEQYLQFSDKDLRSLIEDEEEIE